MNRIRIVRSGISVYEVEVDLGAYSRIKTSNLDGFARRLLRAFPDLRKHECYAGESGGFIDEVKRGTDLAHVMEHVILEILKIACNSRKRFSGWTRTRGKTHVIHFQAPDSRSGRCAARAAASAIEDIIAGKKIDVKLITNQVRDAKEVRPCG